MNYKLLKTNRKTNGTCNAKTEVDLKALDIIKEDNHTLQKNIREFHVLQNSIRNIASKLEGSFESKTGTAIQEVLKNMKRNIP